MRTFVSTDQLENQGGATMLEMVLLLALIALVGIASIRHLGVEAEKTAWISACKMCRPGEFAYLTYSCQNIAETNPPGTGMRVIVETMCDMN